MNRFLLYSALLVLVLGCGKQGTKTPSQGSDSIGISVDPPEDAFIADPDNCRIIKVTPSQKIIHFGKDIPNYMTSGWGCNVRHISIGPSGHLLVTVQSRIWVINSNTGKVIQRNDTYTR